MRRARGLVLFPGAGASSDHHTLVALEDALAPLPVARCDFPYRLAGRRAPDRAPVLVGSVVDHATAFAAEHDLHPRAVVLGGRSMGGRMCSMAVAGGLPAAGLVLLSYPLHPPGKPEKLRIEHLPQLDVPCLFVSGTKDPFGTPEELEREVAAIPGPVTIHWLEGAGHDAKGRDAEISQVVAAWIDRLGRRRG
ncbi:alpha/beta hydrolase family protein [Actinomarinicola tropica]|uniref:alpha/beta hydrolase family protein n=1 Tax=Actinomarinicola tropica TaxID=2789776 RepID=UPI00189AFFA7